MAEYIEREALKNDIAKSTEPFNTGSVFRAINRQIAADVAPVVRCEGCAFSRLDGWVCGGTALMPQHRTFPNSFCSNGERKDGGADHDA